MTPPSLRQLSLWSNACSTTAAGAWAAVCCGLLWVWRPGLGQVATAGELIAPSPAEMRQQEDWVHQNLLAKDGPLPFSFRLDETDSGTFLSALARKLSSTERDPNTTEHTITWSDPPSGLEIRCRSVVYHDFPTVEWTLHFKNTGPNETPILSVAGGQELTHLRLRPNEEIRTPLVVLQFWKGDWFRAQNLWRRWMMAHNLPRPGGKLPEPFTSVCLGLHQSEQTETEGIDLFAQNHAPLNYWWMDAGWYPTEQGWSKVGTWEPDPKRFPRGIRAVSDHAHQAGMKLVLWFEPERVMKGTWLFEQHPEWLLGAGDARLLNLGNAQARNWLTDYMDSFLRRERVDLYRQDFNMDPLPYWRAADAQDRQGITENLHVQGYLAYWDELRRRHPDLLIDSCASGGRRNDLETLRRAVPLLRSDYQEPQNPADLNMLVGNQGHTYGLSFWVPFYGTGQFANDSYAFRSHLCPAMGIGFIPGKMDWPAWHRAWEDWHQAGPNFYGDYYPLTGYNRDEGAWIAWQFHRPELDQGMVQAFRRPKAQAGSMRLKLRGLDPLRTYVVKDRDRSATDSFTGRELMDAGLPVRLDQPRQAALIFYQAAQR